MGENIQLKRVAAVDVKGVIGGYVHGGGKLGVLVALETGLSGERDRERRQGHRDARRGP